MAFVVDERNTSVNIGGMIMTEECVRTPGGGGGGGEKAPSPHCRAGALEK
jgi:hypothetical protein